MIIIDLIFNLALLISVSVLSGFIDIRWRRTTNAGIIMQGILFGLVALLGMINPFVLAPGIIFDGRSVVLSLCALFFGPVAGAIAAGIALAYRIGLGGGGVYMGVSVIISSALIGSIFHYQYIKGKIKANALNLYILGFIVHLVMVALMMEIPSPMRMITFKTLTLTILGIYPIATALIGKILKDQSDSVDRLRAEKALQESETRFRNLFENALMGISETAPDGKLISANLQFAKIYGYDTLEKLMAEVTNVLPFYANLVDRNQIIEVLNQKGAQEPKEVEIIRRDGERRLLLVAVKEVRDTSSRLVRYQASHVDITDRKRAEQELLHAKEKAEAGDRLKAAFINNISHEVRTPLNGILGFTELLRQPDISEEEKEQFNAIIESSSKRLLNTMNNYMDISMIVSGTMEVVVRQIDPRHLLHELKEQIQPMCDFKKIGLALEVPDNKQGFALKTDTDHLRKILSLLLDNAVKFTHTGKVSFGYNLVPGMIEFFVKDTGVGISKEAQERIFDDFIQEDISHTRGYEGSGLGLSIVRGLVRLLHGEIRVESEKGAGSALFFTLPVEPKSGDEFKHDENIPISKKAGEMVILIAEDDESNMQYMETIFKKASLTYIKAYNGLEAVEQCRAHPEITIALMDIKMPVMDGLEATRQIKSFRSDLPVIAITAYAMSGDEKRMLEAGCDDYLAKPVVKDVLLARLNLAVAKHEKGIS